VTLVSNIEHLLALPQDAFRLAIVNRGWRQQAYARVTVLFVVPPKKTLTETYLRNIEEGKTEKKSWYQYIFPRSL
jgi:hypothetical protein